MTENKNNHKTRPLAWRKYVNIAVMAFIVIAASICLVFAFARDEDFSGQLAKVRSALAPVIVGAGIAYVVNPLMRLIERGLMFCMRKVKKQTRARKTARGLSITLSLILVLVLIALLMYLLIPELVTTISGLVNDLPAEIENFMDWFDGIVNEDSFVGRLVGTGVDKATTYYQNFMEDGLADWIAALAASLATGVTNVFGTIYNIAIGIVFSIYFLSAKEQFAAQCRKLTYAFLKKERAERVLRITWACHRKFTGAISGKILDSFIVGIICFIGMNIFRFPYASLISVIVGVTNVIPFFGPYIGAVPSALLILFVSPIKCLWFVIFVVVLQQIDCNILDPRIVGGSIGLSPFWVLFACVVFGSIWGIIGLLIGVPLMACIHMIIKELVEKKLSDKGLSTETDSYIK